MLGQLHDTSIRNAYGLGGLGLRSTFSIFKRSSAGSPQKYRGLSPGTLYSSLMVTWSPPIHEGDAVTETALSAARKKVVSCMAAVTTTAVQEASCGDVVVARYTRREQLRCGFEVGEGWLGLLWRMESSGSGRGWRLDSGRGWILMRLGRSMDPAANVIAVGHAACVSPLAPSGLDMYTSTACCSIVYSVLWRCSNETQYQRTSEQLSADQRGTGDCVEQVRKIRNPTSHLLVAHDGGTSGDGTYLRSIRIHDSIPTF